MHRIARDHGAAPASYFFPGISATRFAITTGSRKPNSPAHTRVSSAIQAMEPIFGDSNDVQVESVVLGVMRKD
jgi:hypothetical protein